MSVSLLTSEETFERVEIEPTSNKSNVSLESGRPSSITDNGGEIGGEIGGEMAWEPIFLAC